MARRTRASTKPGRRRTVARRPGRPGGPAHTEGVREDLLRAARELFSQRGFRAVSVRDIAASARVNPAMVHYHFRNKQGLYRAMLEDTLGPVLARVQEMIGAKRGAADLQELLGTLMQIMAHEPWVPQLIVREVLAQEGPFRDVFVREFASKGAGRLPRLLGHERAEGRIRRDFDLMLGALSLMSLALFPFIALPVAEKVFDFRANDAFVRRLAEHTTRLFMEGAGARGP